MPDASGRFVGISVSVEFVWCAVCEEKTVHRPDNGQANSRCVRCGFDSEEDLRTLDKSDDL